MSGKKAHGNKVSVLEWASYLRKNGRGRHGNGVFTVIFYLYMKKAASEANGQNVNIYLIFIKDRKAFVLFSIFSRMLEIISYFKKLTPVSCFMYNITELLQVKS